MNNIEDVVVVGKQLLELGFTPSFIQNEFVDNALSKAGESSRSEAFAEIITSGKTKVELSQTKLVKAVIKTGKAIRDLNFTDSFIKDSIVETSLRGDNADFRTVAFKEIMK